MPRYTTIPTMHGRGRKDVFAGGNSTPTQWQSERMRGEILPMQQPRRRWFK